MGGRNREYRGETYLNCNLQPRKNVVLEADFFEIIKKSMARRVEEYNTYGLVTGGYSSKNNQIKRKKSVAKKDS
jgi:hypothetical protein